VELVQAHRFTDQLQAFLDLIAAWPLNPADYTPASWLAFDRARQAAEALVAEPSPTGEAEVRALADLVAATQALAAQVDRSGLVALVAMVDDSANLDPRSYTSATWADLQVARFAAERLIAAPVASLAAVEEAATALLAAINALTPQGSDRLAGLVSAIDALIVSPGAYSEASLAALQVPLAAARILLAGPGDPDATAADGAYAALLAAFRALVPLAVGPTPREATDAPSNPDAPQTTSAIVAVKVPQRTIRLQRGHPVRLAAYGYTASGVRSPVRWTSSAPSVAKVSQAGRINPRKAGRATITVTAGARTAKIAVRVVASRPAKARVVKVSAGRVPTSVAIGATVAITGTYRPATAIGAKVTYSSSNPAVAAIDKAGRLTAKTAGRTTITVKAHKSTARYRITVR
jgi:hypothetical protein